MGLNSRWGWGLNSWRLNEIRELGGALALEELLNCRRVVIDGTLQDVGNVVVSSVVVGVIVLRRPEGVHWKMRPEGVICLRRVEIVLRAMRAGVTRAGAGFGRGSCLTAQIGRRRRREILDIIGRRRDRNGDGGLGGRFWFRCH